MALRARLSWLVLPFLVACSSGANDTGGPPASPKGLAVDVAAGGEVVDAATGLRFAFPQGGTGTLTVEVPATPPEPPVAGASVVEIGFSGSQRVSLVLERPTGDGHADLYALAEPRVLVDGPALDGPSWHALAPDSDDGTRVSYTLPLPPPTALSKEAAGTYAWVERERDPRDSALQNKVDAFLGQLLALMPEALRDAVAARRAQAPLTVRFVEDGGETYYSGFTWGPFAGTTAQPVLQLRRDVSDEVVAHEVGHYLSHLLAGDTAFQAIIDAAPDENHGLGDARGRASLTEDYAYFVSYLLVNSPPCRQPRSVLGQRDPRKVDMPGLEGFGCLVFGALRNDATETAPDWQATGQVEGGLAPAGEVLGLFQAGAVSLDALWPQLVQFATAHGVKEEPLGNLLEPIGWSYRVEGQLADHAGVAIGQSLAVAPCEYCSQLVPDAIGAFAFERVGPGDRKLYVGGTSVKVPYTVAASLTTPSPVQVGAVKLGDDGLVRTIDGGVTVVVGKNGASTPVTFHLEATLDGVDLDRLDAAWQALETGEVELGAKLRSFLPSAIDLTATAAATTTALEDQNEWGTCQGTYQVQGVVVSYKVAPGGTPSDGMPADAQGETFSWTGQPSSGAFADILVVATLVGEATATEGCTWSSHSFAVPVALGKVTAVW